MSTVNPSNGQRLSCTGSLNSSSSGHPSDPVTLPRKRRSRAVGEVAVTSHQRNSSSVYLNGPPSAEPVRPAPEPVYQNEAAAISQRFSHAHQRPKLLTSMRVCHGEGGENSGKVTMTVSTFVGSFWYKNVILSKLYNFSKAFALSKLFIHETIKH